MSAGEINELIPGTMSLRETHPLTSALLVGFGSVTLLLVVIVVIAWASSSG